MSPEMGSITQENKTMMTMRRYLLLVPRVDRMGKVFIIGLAKEQAQIEELEAKDLKARISQILIHNTTTLVEGGIEYRLVTFAPISSPVGKFLLDLVVQVRKEESLANLECLRLKFVTKLELKKFRVFRALSHFAEAHLRKVDPLPFLRQVPPAVSIKIEGMQVKPVFTAQEQYDAVPRIINSGGDFFTE